MIRKRKSVDPKSAISFKILPDNEIVNASQGETILQALIKAGIEVDYSCESGTCGTCRVFIDEGLEMLGPRNEIEEEFATERKFQKNERLACQCRAHNGLVVRKPKN